MPIVETGNHNVETSSHNVETNVETGNRNVVTTPAMSHPHHTYTHHILQVLYRGTTGQTRKVLRGGPSLVPRSGLSKRTVW